MAFIPSACPSYEGRTHLRQDRHCSQISLNHIPSVLYQGATNRAQRMDDIPRRSSHLFVIWILSPLLYWKVPPESTHPNTSHGSRRAEIEILSLLTPPLVKTLCATSHHLHFPDFLLNLMELCVFTLLVSQERQELRQILSLVVSGHTGQAFLDWMGRNKVFR